jgi:NTP pyrophosphatase (non-canonical NTP hydrolase)
MNFEELEQQVVAWAAARQIIPNSNAMSQALKTAEEVVELLQAINKQDSKEVIDAYGDCLVTLIIGAELYGVNLVACLEMAYGEIKDRKGHLGKDGIFYKDQA